MWWKSIRLRDSFFSVRNTKINHMNWIFINIRPMDSPVFVEWKKRSTSKDLKSCPGRLIFHTLSCFRPTGNMPCFWTIPPPSLSGRLVCDRKTGRVLQLDASQPSCRYMFWCFFSVFQRNYPSGLVCQCSGFADISCCVHWFHCLILEVNRYFYECLSGTPNKRSWISLIRQWRDMDMPCPKQPWINRLKYLNQTEQTWCSTCIGLYECSIGAYPMVKTWVNNLVEFKKVPVPSSSLDAIDASRASLSC